MEPTIPTKIGRIEILKAMSLKDKLVSCFFALVGLFFLAYGLHLLGSGGWLLLVGAVLFFFFVVKTFKIVETEIKEALKKRSANSSLAPAVGAAGAADTNNDLIRNIIDKKKQNPQQGLLNNLMGGSAMPEEDEEQARADHEYLVEMFRKKEEAMRTAPMPPTDPIVQRKIVEEQEAYIDELMKPTIVPQRELAEKTPKKD